MRQALAEAGFAVLARNEGDWAAGVAAYGMPDLALDYELSKSRFATWYETQIGNPAELVYKHLKKLAATSASSCTPTRATASRGART